MHHNAGQYRAKYIHTFRNTNVNTLIRQYGKDIFDKKDPKRRRRINIKKYPLVDENGAEIPVFDKNGKRISRRTAIADNEPPCGVLMDLNNIQALFNPPVNNRDDDLIGSPPPEERYVNININAYPLGFLRVAGNIQASGIPHCFHRVITKINQKVRRELDCRTSPDASNDTYMADLSQPHRPSAVVVKPISSQFYNQIMHRIATRAGRLDSQQGSATAALSGAFAQNKKDQATAKAKQEYCDRALPSDRFHRKIDRPDCPTCCRAELVYSVDVRRLEHQSSKYVTRI